MNFPPAGVDDRWRAKWALAAALLVLTGVLLSPAFAWGLVPDDVPAAHSPAEVHPMTPTMLIYLLPAAIVLWIGYEAIRAERCLRHPERKLSKGR